jgi:peptidyl-prolyl cis-trans isomerase C
MKIKCSLILLLFSLSLLGACDSSKEEREVKKQPAPATPQISKTKLSEGTPPEALAKVADRYVTVADYERQMLKFSPKLAESEPGRKYVLNQYIEGILIEKEAEARGWKTDPAVRSKIEEYTRSLYRNTLLQSLKDTQKSISDEEAKRYFQEHEEEFIQPDRIRVSLIETGPDQEKEINAAYKEVRAGKDFAQLASAHSKHPSSKNGGDLGFLTRKQYKHLTEVAFTIKPGEISKPFKSPTGWHIIKVTELIKKQDIPLEEGVKRAKARLEAMEASKAYDALMKSLREKNNVVLYEDRLKQLQPAAEGAGQQQPPAKKGS